MSKTPIANTSPWSSVSGGIEYTGGTVNAPSGFKVNDYNQLNAFGLAATGILLREAVSFSMSIGQVNVLGADVLEFNINDTLAGYRFQMGNGDVIALASGFLTLPKEPTADSHAATKKYVDENGSQWDDVASGINYAGGNVGIGTDTPTGNLTVPSQSIHFNKPSDHWTNSTYMGVAGYGGLTTHGSYEISIVANGYRNSAGTWTSNGINGYTGATAIHQHPQGYIRFCTEGTKASGSSSNVTERMRIDSNGLVTAAGGYTVNANNKLNAFGVAATGIVLQAGATHDMAIGQTSVLGADSLDFNLNNNTASYRFYTGSSNIVSIASGYLSLPLTPTADSHAVRKDYVDYGFVQSTDGTSKNLNSWTGQTEVSAVNVTSNGPFGNGAWYNVVNVRHRNGNGDGEQYGGQLAWGMTNYEGRLAFRRHSSTWQPWHEVATHGDPRVAVAVAKVSTSGGFLSNKGFSAVNRLQAGWFDLTLSSSIATNDQIIQITTDSGAICGGALPLTTTTFRVTLINVLSNGYQDSNFNVTVHDGP